jgi:hydrogenase maturation protein HypF
LDGGAREIADSEPISQAAYFLRHGGIIAVKGLGGYHLACNAFDEHAVRRLRSGKRREDKPFALMAPDMKAIKGVCFVSDEEEKLLRSARRPIVLLRRYGNSPIAHEVAPGYRYLGWMLPYTPLHHLLLADAGLALVMTSGNLSDEPIAFKDADALHRLALIADYFLVHDRDIHVRCDDSVTRVIGRHELMMRRSRSYAPQPVRLAAPVAAPVLACGAHLKNTFCLAKERHAFMSHHIGDLENYETLDSFERGIEHFKRLFDISPAVVAHDLHPDYLSTKYALKLAAVRTVGVQHHHAHIASCMAEHGLSEPVIGVALDGAGYGPDGTIWGGEFLVADLAGFQRRAHFRNVALAGGVAAIRQPWRMGLSYLLDSLGENPHALNLPGWKAISAKQIELVSSMIARGVNSVPTSSCGRLFDAVASLLALRHEVNHEGQAAVELESIAAEGVEETYPFTLGDVLPWTIDMRPMIGQIVRELQTKTTVRQIAARFHNTVAALILDVCERLRDLEGLNSVCLGGGVFQNAYLVERVVPVLHAACFNVYRNHKVPPNDGGIALGQAVIAGEMARRGG